MFGRVVYPRHSLSLAYQLLQAGEVFTMTTSTRTGVSSAMAVLGGTVGTTAGGICGALAGGAFGVVTALQMGMGWGWLVWCVGSYKHDPVF